MKVKRYRRPKYTNEQMIEAMRSVAERGVLSWNGYKRKDRESIA